MEMEEKGARLKAVRKNYKLNQKEFAESIEVTQPHLSSMENGGRSLSASVIENIAQCYNEVNVDWLIHGRGEMHINSSANRVQSTPESRHLIAENVTYLDQNDVLEEESGEYVKEKFVLVGGVTHAGIALDIPTKRGIRNTFSIPGIAGPGMIVQVQGNSMTPVLTDGDYIVVTEKLNSFGELKPDSIYLVIDSESTARVKYVHMKEKGFELRSANGIEYPPLFLIFDEVKELWPVKLRITVSLEVPDTSPHLTARIAQIEQYLSKNEPGWHTGPPHSSKEP
jgi:phage repressor protein C with HTH and peptisase S24 domain